MVHRCILALVIRILYFSYANQTITAKNGVYILFWFSQPQNKNLWHLFLSPQNDHNYRKYHFVNTNEQKTERKIKILCFWLHRFHDDNGWDSFSMGVCIVCLLFNASRVCVQGVPFQWFQNLIFCNCGKLRRILIMKGKHYTENLHSPQPRSPLRPNRCEVIASMPDWYILEWYYYLGMLFTQQHL